MEYLLTATLLSLYTKNVVHLRPNSTLHPRGQKSFSALRGKTLARDQRLALEIARVFSAL